jgi:hypothetical protein
MQKVEGSNPFSRSQKGPHLQAFFRVRSRLVRLRRVGLAPDSPLADRRPFQEKRPVCRSILVRPNRSPSAGLQKVECSACCGRWPAVPANGTFLHTDACPRAASDPDPSGRVRFQSGYREANPLPRTATPASHGSHRRDLTADGVRGSGEAPVTGGWAVAIARGSSPRLSLPSEAGVCSQPGWAPAHRPERASTLLGQRRADQRESSGAPSARSATRRTASCVLLLSPRRCR